MPNTSPILWLLFCPFWGLASCGISTPIAERPELAAPAHDATGIASYEPAEDGPGFPFRLKNGFVMTSVATGDHQFTDDFIGRDRRAAIMFRGQAGIANERGMGAAVDFKFVLPHDDFYENSINRTAASQFDIFPSVFFDPLTKLTRGRFRLPVHAGPYISVVNSEFSLTGAETDYLSFGGRVEIRPEVVLSPPMDEFEASLIARFSAGLHFSDIDDESTGRAYYSSGYTLGIELGTRLVFGRVALKVAYIRNTLTIRESDTEHGYFIPRLETDFEGVEFSIGMSF